VSAHICPKPSDFPPAFSKKCLSSGFWVIDQETQSALSQKKDAHFGGDEIEKLEQFIAAATDPPVYLGWGSMIAISPEHMAALAVRALKQTGIRGIILGGFAQLQPSHLEAAADAAELGAYARDNVLFVKTAPHEWLFPRCKIVVHHGGAGTTAAGRRAGVPSVITPCFADQFDNAALMQASGAGIGLAQFKKLSANDLAVALRACAEPKVASRAKELGKLLHSEDGVLNAEKAITSFMETEVATGAWLQKHEMRMQERERRNSSWLKCCGSSCYLCAACCLRQKLDPIRRSTAATAKVASAPPAPLAIEGR